MEFALNYSPAAAELIARGAMTVDRFKCPAWPDLIDRLTATGTPVYVHFPLLVGTGRGCPVDTETGDVPDWGRIEDLMARTGTPWVSAHLGPRPEDHPGLADRPWKAQIEIITDTMVRDLAPLVARFGADRVVGENIFEFFGMHLRPAVMPKVLRSVVESVGCGLLLDLSHARLAARDLGIDARDYIEALPVDHVREVHVTGIQRFDATWVARMRAHGVNTESITRLEGQWVDHLPMTEEDWAFFAWALGRIHRGSWATPEIIAYEYGGLGPWFEALTIPERLAAQVPRLAKMVHSDGARPPGTSPNGAAPTRRHRR